MFARGYLISKCLHPPKKQTKIIWIEVQGFHDFRSFNFSNFQINVVFNSILFSFSLVEISNSDLRGFSLSTFIQTLWRTFKNIEGKEKKEPKCNYKLCRIVNNHHGINVYKCFSLCLFLQKKSSNMKRWECCKILQSPPLLLLLRKYCVLETAKPDRATVASQGLAAEGLFSTLQGHE